jgi:hypothetical protein
MVSLCCRNSLLLPPHRQPAPATGLLQVSARQQPEEEEEDEVQPVKRPTSPLALFGLGAKPVSGAEADPGCMRVVHFHPTASATAGLRYTQLVPHHVGMVEHALSCCGRFLGEQQAAAAAAGNAREPATAVWYLWCFALLKCISVLVGHTHTHTW